MSRPPFDDFFHLATGNTPYDYQRRLACGSQADPDIPGTFTELPEARTRTLRKGKSHE